MQNAANFVSENNRFRAQHSLNEIKARIDLRDLVASIWGAGKKSGRAVLYQARWRGDDDTPSFAVYADGYMDFGTGERGDVFTFLQTEYRLNFGEAVDWLRNHLGIYDVGIPSKQHGLGGSTHTNFSATESVAEPPSSAWQTAGHQALQTAIETLWQTPAVLDYLHNERGLNDETIRHFQLGYNPQWTPISIDDGRAKPVYLAPGIVIPYNNDGALWALRVRCRVGDFASALGIVEDTGHNNKPLPKYLNLSGSKVAGTLFGGDALTTKVSRHREKYTQTTNNVGGQCTTVNKRMPPQDEPQNINTTDVGGYLCIPPQDEPTMADGYTAPSLRMPPQDVSDKNTQVSRRRETLADDDPPPGRPVLIVEGEFDMMLARQHLRHKYTVITPGPATNTLAKRWRDLLLNRDHIFVMMDADSAGNTALSKIRDQLGERVIEVLLAKNHDVTDTVKSGRNIEHLCDHAWYLYRHQIESAITARADDLVPDGAWWAQGMPDVYRSALLSYLPAASAPLLELINNAICEEIHNHKAFTINDVLRANEVLNFGMASSTLRRTFMQVWEVFFSKVPTESLLVQTKNTAGKSEKKAKGRTADVYALLPLNHMRRNLMKWAKPRIIEQVHPVSRDYDDEELILAEPSYELLKAIGVDNDDGDELLLELESLYESAFEQQEDKQEKAGWRARGMYTRLMTDLMNETVSTPLAEYADRWTLGKTRDYRAALLWATNDPTEHRSRRSIAHLLGITPRSVSDMVKYAGLEKVSPYGEFEHLPVKSADDVERAVKRFAGKVAGYPRMVVKTRKNGLREIAPYSVANVADAVVDCKANGGAVEVRFQIANRYQPKIARDALVSDTLPTTVINNAPIRAQTAQNAPAGDGVSEQSTKAEKPRKTALKRFYGPSHHPQWVTGQLKLALLMMGWEAIAVGDDAQTGGYADPPLHPIFHGDAVDSTVVDFDKLYDLTTVAVRNPRTGAVIPADGSARRLLAAVLERDVFTGDECLTPHP